jgi:hypothetical protein
MFERGKGYAAIEPHFPAVNVVKSIAA